MRDSEILPQLELPVAEMTMTSSYFDFGRFRLPVGNWQLCSAYSTDLSALFSLPFHVFIFIVLLFFLVVPFLFGYSLLIISVTQSLETWSFLCFFLIYFWGLIREVPRNSAIFEISQKNFWCKVLSEFSYFSLIALKVFSHCFLASITFGEMRMPIKKHYLSNYNVLILFQCFEYFLYWYCFQYFL